MGPREAAVYALHRVLYEGAFSNIVLSEAILKADLKEDDRALCTELLYGTLKYKGTIDYIIKHYVNRDIKKIDKSILNILRITIYQIKYLNKIPSYAAVNEAVNIAKKLSGKGAAGFVNGVIRNYLRNGDSFVEEINDSIEKLSVKYSFPVKLTKLIMKQYGEGLCEKILCGLNETPDVTVRVNSLKSDYEKICDDLIKEGYNIKEGLISPEAVHIIKGKSIENNHLFKEGYITVQDESAMMVAPSMELREGLTVIDLCSAPGGKTTHIGELMNNKGIIISGDIHENKLSLIKANCLRLGVSIAQCRTLDAAEDVEEFHLYGDRVLIDVPCSGLGIIRKKPEIKWNKAIDEIKSIIKIQRNIMKSAAAYVKKDGILFYSTCTLNKDENENNIKWFLKENKNFKLESLDFGKSDDILYNNGMATILPNEYVDGFFLAKLRRVN